ncbi:hypothetical protein [Pedobacter jeongneungensis]|uniref:hypothetical protein n=1 Tax=Pedobacter jeongneungensis TaxID=947309 RepID=UPI00046A0F5A|nr:hypothetical protein [Pedobacter jeongneungensis]
MKDDQEYENIQKFLKVNKEIEQTSSLIKSYERYSRDTADLNTKLRDFESQQSQLRDVLSDPNSTPSTESRFRNLHYQLQIIHEKLALNAYGDKIDRNQGLILENFIYNDVLRDIEGSLSWEFIGASIPTYYYSLESDFDFNPLKDLLSQIMDELKKMNEPPAHFIELYALHNAIRDRIIEVAIKEYNENRDNTKPHY